MSAVRGFLYGVFCFVLFDALVILGLIITLNLTLLNPDFVTSEIEKLDVYSLLTEQAKALLPSQQFIDTECLNKALADLRPWFEQQAGSVIHNIWDYLKGADTINATISLEQVRSVAKKYAKEAALKSLPPQLQNISQTQMEAYMAQIYTEIDRRIPANFTLNEGSIGSHFLAQIKKIKQVVGLTQIAYKWLIGLAILLVCLIALVHWWQPRPIIRSTGITFILVGLVCVLGSLLDVLVSRALSRLAIEAYILPVIQPKLPQLVSDLTAPLRNYGLGFLVSGLAMVMISVILRYSETSPANAAKLKI